MVCLSHIVLMLSEDEKQVLTDIRFRHTDVLGMVVWPRTFIFSRSRRRG